MQEEPPDELDCVQSHRFHLIASFGVTITKRDATVVQRQQATVGDGDSVRITGQVFQDGFRSAKRRLGVDDPLRLL